MAKVEYNETNWGWVRGVDRGGRSGNYPLKCCWYCLAELCYKAAGELGAVGINQGSAPSATNSSQPETKPVKHQTTTSGSRPSSLTSSLLVGGVILIIQWGEEEGRRVTLPQIWKILSDGLSPQSPAPPPPLIIWFLTLDYPLESVGWGPSLYLLITSWSE